MPQSEPGADSAGPVVPVPEESVSAPTSSGDEPHAAPSGELSPGPLAGAPDREESGHSPGVPAFAGLPFTGIEPAAETEPAGEPPEHRRPSAVHRARLAFRAWRRTRPFWGGLLIFLGGSEILFSEKAPFKVILHIGLQGLAGYLLPAVMVLCGLLLWFSPAQRTFYSVLSVLLALGTWLTSNLGGFIIGMLLGLVGGSLAFGWAPKRPPRPAQAPAAPVPDSPQPAEPAPAGHSQ